MRPRQMVDIQRSITIMGGREVSRPYQVWFFAEGERFLSFWRFAKRLFFMFLFQSPSIFPLNRFIRLHGVNHNQPFPTANQELIWSVSSFFLWLLMVKMSDF